MVVCFITSDSNTVSFAAEGFLIKDLNLVKVDGLLLSVTRDVLKILTEVTATGHLLELLITRALDNAWKGVVKGILELSLPENVLTTRSMMRHLEWHVE